ncbi:hypothetical protein BLOT_013521 [Blomia tropicalis]|nr:hypothetical protein BLOT_013521 [Blomia tropicalis]
MVDVAVHLCSLFTKSLMTLGSFLSNLRPLILKKWNEMFDGRDEFCPLADSSGTWYWPDFNFLNNN